MQIDDFDSSDAEKFEGVETEPVATEPIKEELRFAQASQRLLNPLFLVYKLLVNSANKPILGSWANYYMKIVLLTGIFICFIAMLIGRCENTILAQAWFKANKDLLGASFSTVSKKALKFKVLDDRLKVHYLTYFMEYSDPLIFTFSYWMKSFKIDNSKIKL